MFVQSNLNFAQCDFPLKCPIPACKAEIGDQKVALLLANRFPMIWADFQRLSVYNCLMQENKDDHVLVCPKCGKYAVLYLPPPKKPLSIEEKIRFVEDQKIAKISGLRNAYKFQLAKAKQANDLEHKKLTQEVDEKVKLIGNEHEKRIKVLQEKQKSNRGSFKDEVIFFLKTSFGFKVTEYEAADYEEKEISSWEVSESTKFFVCPIEECKGCLCVLCMKPVLIENISSHFCIEADVDLLYNEVLDVLASNATRRCPKCDFRSQKDLECTHMTCPKCSTVYCYVCGRSEKEFPSKSLYTHNKWTLQSPPDTDQCPMYLQSKYGEYVDGPRMNGDPAKALMKFHLELQRKAIDALKSKKDSRLWDAMLKRHFPNGIFEDV
jgi:hypothetical protein